MSIISTLDFEFLPTDFVLRNDELPVVEDCIEHCVEDLSHLWNYSNLEHLEDLV